MAERRENTITKSKEEKMSSTTITLLFLLFAVIMFVLEKVPLGVQIAIQNGHLCHVRRSVCDIIGGQPKTN